MVKTMAQAQITNGGPIILFQPENEYSLVRNNQVFPDGTYMQYVINQAHDNCILVPIISNDAHPSGHNAPGTGLGEVDIYGYNAYPLGFNCARPEDWRTGKLPTNWADLHLQQSPNTPFSILEFQGGSYDIWGGNGYEKCAELLNHEFTRVFNKNNIAFGINILNMYMVFGGTNWGNLGYPRGYTSYDYGATIAEDRTITRKKEAVPRRATTALTTTADLTVTPFSANETGLWVLRHTDYSQRKKTEYEITLPTRAGNITIPQLVGKLTLNGRDSKILTTDLQLRGNTHLRYSSAEILAITEWMAGKSSANIYEHRQGAESSIKTKRQGDSLVVAWDAAKDRSIVDVGSTRLVLLGKDSAYDYWVIDLQNSGQKQKIFIKGPYLVRSVRVQGNRLDISADFNQTTTVEVFAVPAQVKKLFINHKKSKHSEPIKGVCSTNVSFETPCISLPDLSTSSWKFLDSLPEVKPEYDDAGWPKADLRDSHNDYRALSTPTSLYSEDYGFHAGLLIYRGHFVSSGNQTGLEIWNQGGWAFSSSVWLNGIYLGSSKVNATRPDADTTYEFPRLDQGRRYTLTILQDNQGYELNPWVGDDKMKHPRGILNYTLQQREQESISWRITGNLGGENYQDRVRGPLNEGGSFVERSGFHQPGPPTNECSRSKRNPITKGFSGPGLGYFTTSFDLNLPQGWDAPLFFSFANETVPTPAYRAQLFVNGYNFGHYINEVGPQKSFHIPEGVLNHQGENWLGILLWCQEPDGMKLDDLTLEYKCQFVLPWRGSSPFLNHDGERERMRISFRRCITHMSISYYGLLSNSLGRIVFFYY
ncbi:hypothetical protein LCI18_010291 [Fusarium solani-melongenae]|uniref:Uncharacterized protein n=1 Tax=Fusarium solani subsp. cucurbitae TaxID=2747967 RepID=A0ACD3ZDU2_FUSSC|nr:hypothetical protein LCI18_010291 [Fusarium solani-melongenae]